MERGELHPVAQAAADAEKIMSPMKYRVRWRGTKSPIGAFVGGVAVAFARHDMLADSSGQMIGRYDRLSEFSGPSGDEHEMIVSVKAEFVFSNAILVERVLDQG